MGAKRPSESAPWRFFGYFLPGQKVTRPAGRNPARRPLIGKTPPAKTSSRLQAHLSLGLLHLNSERIPPRRVVVNCPQRLAAAGTRIFQSSTGRSPVSGKVLPDGKTLGIEIDPPMPSG